MFFNAEDFGYQQNPAAGYGSLVPRRDAYLLPSYGTCKRFIKVFGYNLMTNRCTEYIYSGCGGNPNRFATDSQCRNTCFVVRKRVTVSEPDYYEDEDATEAIQIDKRKLSRLRGIGRING
uniref:Tissue factor pathway inhibitor-like n=1 Tax=Drosophila rhopaloa TaxID=1041015 RepID=A0A6P4ETS9_DRORH